MLHATEANGIQIVGTISAYRANRTITGALPGLSVAEDVSHFHEVASWVQSIDEANKKKSELQKSQKDSKEIDSREPSKYPDAQNVE